MVVPKVVVILRGLPGSGKSTFSKFFKKHHYISMDLFWTKDSGDFKFDYDRLQEAIEWTHNKFLHALYNDHPATPRLIVVDNVNYAMKHFQFFVDAAKAAGAQIHYIHVERPLGDLSNNHGVSEEKIFSMAEKWEHIL